MQITNTWSLQQKFITNTESFAFIVVLIFGLLSQERSFIYKQKKQLETVKK